MGKKQSCSKLLEMARKQIKNDIENVDQKLGKKLEKKKVVRNCPKWREHRWKMFSEMLGI